MNNIMYHEPLRPSFGWCMGVIVLISFTDCTCEGVNLPARCSYCCSPCSWLHCFFIRCFPLFGCFIMKYPNIHHVFLKLCVQSACKMQPSEPGHNKYKAHYLDWELCRLASVLWCIMSLYVQHLFVGCHLSYIY